MCTNPWSLSTWQSSPTKQATFWRTALLRGRCAQNDWRKAEVMRQIGQDYIFLIEKFRLPKRTASAINCQNLQKLEMLAVGFASQRRFLVVILTSRNDVMCLKYTCFSTAKHSKSLIPPAKEIILPKAIFRDAVKTQKSGSKLMYSYYFILLPHKFSHHL